MTNLSIPFDNSYARLPERFFVRQNPEPVGQPKLIRLNEPLCKTLGINPISLSSSDGENFFAGNLLPPGAEPIALAYAGHQFGSWVPRLGDGRAVLMGEIIGIDGLRRDIQLKGSGQTPFSRGGDGRAALGPVLREYLVSEAMHALGVPTTRTLAATTTGENVMRERQLPGAILTRVAKCHVRVGTFEYFSARQDQNAIRTLADYVIDRLYPDARMSENPYSALLSAVVLRQAQLVAKWFGVGFIHGVMNTDNTSIAGETIDYGPCAFMDIYDPHQVFSSIDRMGRYAFDNQASINQWNLVQFAQCLLPLLDLDIKKAVTVAEKIIDLYPSKFKASLKEVMCAKLGLTTTEEDDLTLGIDLLQCMADGGADFTNTFRYLANTIDGTNPNDNSDVRVQFTNPVPFDQWLIRWQKRLNKENSPLDAVAVSMHRINPAVIARNHLIEAAIRAAEDNADFMPFNDLLDAVAKPFKSHQPGSYFVRPPSSNEVVLQTFCGT
jgi:uncharacterized protein YdiU (UPF0061 family)